jgi:uncharacterized protein YcfL
MEKESRLIAVLALVSALCACSSTTTTTLKPAEQTLILDKEIQGMSRNEVITAINECESSGTRAIMIFAKRKINGYSADVVVDVTCAPKFKL